MTAFGLLFSAAIQNVQSEISELLGAARHFQERVVQHLARRASIRRIQLQTALQKVEELRRPAQRILHRGRRACMNQQQRLHRHFLAPPTRSGGSR